jgi:sulfate adenylyltransferase subunit 2
MHYNKYNKEYSADNLYLQNLEDEAIYIIREALAEFKNPVLLYSIGKDSSVLLHLLLKAFYPAKPNIKLVHIDTGWKFKEMIEFRDRQVKKFGLDLIVYTNPRGDAEQIFPFGANSKNYTDIMKTESLRHILDKHGFDAALGGARRDEEKSRSKERIFSFRNQFHSWDPKHQRPEMFNLFNCQLKNKESMRVFPLSNWRELDVWQYIKQENIEIVPLYFSKERPVVVRSGMKIVVDDERLPINSDEEAQLENVRFRTLGCYPLTAAVNSRADNLDKIIIEMENANVSERSGRLIDKDQSASMEKKKLEGYF